MQLLTNGPRQAKALIALAHGAGAAMDSPAMNAFARGLAERGHRVVRFEFPYMQRRRQTGKRGGPDRAPVLLQTWHRAIEQIRSRRADRGNDRPGGPPLIIGGKSMGGRIASMVADEAGVAGLVCLGYPFHPPGKPEKLRTAHLARLRTPTLILQGTRDPFGRPDEVDGYELSRSIHLVWIQDGDHSFKPRKSSGRTLAENVERAIDSIDDFASRLQ